MERELLLLGLLRREDMHGYQLHENFSGILASCTDLKKSTTYFLLDKMEKRGWVTVSLLQDSNRPARKVYQLTPEGEAAFVRLLRENLASYSPAIFGGDVGLAFMDALSPAEALSLLDERRRNLAEQVDIAQGIPIHGGSLQFMIEHRLRHLETELAWLDSVIERCRTAFPAPTEHTSS
jgi:DNA-binding PadR family transcriptional regulator